MTDGFEVLGWLFMIVQLLATLFVVVLFVRMTQALQAIAKSLKALEERVGSPGDGQSTNR